MHIKIQMRTKKLILQGAGDEKKNQSIFGNFSF